jgi:hypothetical protein
MAKEGAKEGMELEDAGCGPGIGIYKLPQKGGHPDRDKFEQMKRELGPGWQKYFYTGDYDLHEAYNKERKQIPEASKEAVTMIGDINAALRPGVLPPAIEPTAALMSATPLSITDPFAPIQHGPQATFLANAVLEAPHPPLSQIHRAPRRFPVNPPGAAREEAGGLAWCHKGT